MIRNGVVILWIPPGYNPDLGVTLTQEGKNQSSSVGAGVGMLVGEGVGVTVAVGVAVGLGVAEGVAVGVGVGEAESAGQPTRAKPLRQVKSGNTARKHGLRDQDKLISTRMQVARLSELVRCKVYR